ncbi:phosphomevalonate kinase [Erysipelothrix urinaevulpis]|uniref:phosphomevalonate kinase n=1 Tax=Erysipelothrix urinaevulpis TaxID=2683717 RepID=UPI001356C348|nr:phosphomevalonate kinase [Erysipelothrix urinaevulpis]
MTNYKFPGKLFLIGEYFITEPHGEAVIAAVNRFINVSSKKSATFKLRSDYGSIDGLKKDVKSKDIEIANMAVNFTYDYLDYLNVKKQMLSLELNSTLLVKDKKIGLGSSGVVIVAITQTILKEHNIHLSKLEQFKFAVLCQRMISSQGSSGDIAAAVYGGIIHYQAYDFEWLNRQMIRYDLIKKPWPLLQIDAIKLKGHYKLEFGWTQSTNGTNGYLDTFSKWKSKNPKTYQIFTKEALTYVKMFIQGDTKTAIKKYRQLMLKLQDETLLNIETNQLKQAIEIVERHHGFAKVSGSGGGDCLFALIDDNTDVMEIKRLWQDVKIVPLELEVWDDNTFKKKRRACEVSARSA